MQFKSISSIFAILALTTSMAPSLVLAAESSTLLSRSLQDDYSKTVNAQQQSAMSLSKLKPSDKSKNYDLSWNLSMNEWIYQNPLNKENLFHMNAGLNMNYFMTQNLSVNLSPSFSYFNGYTQTQNEVQGNNSFWTMKNATLDLKAANLFYSSIGAVNQQVLKSSGDLMHTPLLMDDRSFPAIAAEVSTGGNSNLGLMTEVAIPTSASLTTQTGEQESNPSFQSFGAFMAYKTARMKFELLADYFSFSNLPSSVAMQSGLLGNTVNTPNGNANSTDNVFAYNYHGLETHGKVSVVLSNYWRGNATVGYIQNSGAPSDKNTALLGLISADWIAAKDLMLSPTYMYFTIKSDSVVASYNDAQYMPNMAGYAGGLTLQYRKSFKVSLIGGERTPLVEDPNQFHEHFWSFKLEMLNVAI